MPIQPDGMTTDHGVILTVGLQSNVDRAALVMPIVFNGTSLNASTICADAVNSFADTAMGFLQDCFSLDASIVYIQAEGMVDGYVPFRLGYMYGVNAGTRPAAVVSAQVCSLVTFYAEPADLVPNTRMKTAKSFIPMLSKVDVVGDQVSSTMSTNLDAFGLTLLTGWPSSTYSTLNWYRILKGLVSPRIPGPATRIANAEGRTYVSTQRRRLKARLV